MRHFKKSCSYALTAGSLILAVFLSLAAAQTAPKAKRATLNGPVQMPAPRTVDITHYLIRTRFDRKTKTVYGDETISFKPLNTGTRNISFHANGLTIEALTLGGTKTALKWKTEKPDRLSIELDRAYQPSESVAVRVRYRVSNPRKGIYFTPESKLPGTKVRRPPQIWTQGEPEENRYWFVGHDYPNDVATSEQYITTTAPDEIALGNGALVETIANPDGTRTFHWKMAEPHVSYLTSLIVGAFVKVEDSATLPPLTPDGAERRVPIENYTYAGAEDAARIAYGGTPKMLQLFAQKTGISFPFNKYAQTGVAFFTQFEGMENVTSTTLADSSVLRSSLFRTPAALTPDAERDVTNLVSHELAHSWFGNLVTCTDWANLWLNEGLATFMEAVYQESRYGKAGYLREMRTNQDLYLAEDSYRYRRPIVTNRFPDPNILFDGTTYKKGGFIVNMLRRHLGDEVFWRGINLYLTRHAHQNVTTPDFQRALEEVSGQKLDWFFQQWVYQAGYPELKVRYRYDAKNKQLALAVQQTQATDALTPAVFRLPGVKVEITTPAGVRTESIDITERSQTFNIALDQAPTRLLFDADERILKVLDYPQQPETEAVFR